VEKERGSLIIASELLKSERPAPDIRVTYVEPRVRKIPNRVTPNMPLNRATPSACRVPAPVAITNDTTPRMKANEALTIRLPCGGVAGRLIPNRHELSW
jgi:hypothetical protein